MRRGAPYGVVTAQDTAGPVFLATSVAEELAFVRLLQLLARLQLRPLELALHSQDGCQSFSVVVLCVFLAVFDLASSRFHAVVPVGPQFSDLCCTSDHL